MSAMCIDGLLMCGFNVIPYLYFIFERQAIETKPQILDANHFSGS